LPRYFDAIPHADLMKSWATAPRRLCRPARTAASGDRRGPFSIGVGLAIDRWPHIGGGVCPASVNLFSLRVDLSSSGLVGEKGHESDLFARGGYPARTCFLVGDSVIELGAVLSPLRATPICPATSTRYRKRML
jgi:hypothetical protein